MQQYVLEGVDTRDLDAFLCFLQSKNLGGDIGEITAHVQNYSWILLSGKVIGYAIKDAQGKIHHILTDKN